MNINKFGEKVLSVLRPGSGRKKCKMVAQVQVTNFGPVPTPIAYLLRGEGSCHFLRDYIKTGP